MLLGALVVVVVGALVGTYLGVRGQALRPDGLLVGHQGYEYIELGRVWQIALIARHAALARAGVPGHPAGARPAEKDRGGLTHLLLYASVSIPLFYSVGLFYTPGTHIAVADYWRWWVVHLWVENFFEVFATVALAFVLTRMGAVGERPAQRATYFSILLYLGAGIIGTFHHLYFSGAPLFITALGATFSALEIVPLTLLGFEVHAQPEAGALRRQRRPVALASLLLRRGGLLEHARRRRASASSSTRRSSSTTPRGSTRRRSTPTARCSASTASWPSP